VPYNDVYTDNRAVMVLSGVIQSGTMANFSYHVQIKLLLLLLYRYR